MNTFLFVVSTPNGICFENSVQSVMLRGTGGDFAVYAGHIPFVTAVVPCIGTVTLSDGTKKECKTDGGILSVEKSKTVFITSNFKLD